MYFEKKNKPDFRDHLLGRHSMTLEALSDATVDLASAAKLEEIGNWFLAGEAYSQVDEERSAGLGDEDRARLLVRAACCFEAAGQPRPASRAFSDAARMLERGKVRHQECAELFNRSANCSLQMQDFFAAGTKWMAAAKAYERTGGVVLSSSDNIHPLPASASGFAFAGKCYRRAGEVFQLTSDDGKWACMAYWLCGKAHAKSAVGPNIQTFNGFRDALLTGIDQYGTLDLERVRTYLPLSEEERRQKIDPFEVVEQAFYACELSHLKLNGKVQTENTARNTTISEMAHLLRTCAFKLARRGNLAEASKFRTLAASNVQRSLRFEKKWGRWLLYAVWNATSLYGESLARWASFCLLSIGAFGGLYALTGSIAPTESVLDHIYFSIVTFTSLGYGDISPTDLVGKTIASFEIMVGVIMFGVLLSFATNRLKGD